MGIPFATDTESTLTRYFYSEAEKKKISLLRVGDLSGDTIRVPVEPVVFDRSGMDPIFSQSRIGWNDFGRGYRPFSFHQSGLRSTAAFLRYREIRVADVRLFASAAGEILVPVEFEPLIPQFRRAAGYFTGSYGPLTEDTEMQFTVHRDLIRLPGLPQTITFPHCDYAGGKNPDYIRPPKIFFASADFGATGFHADLSLMDVTSYNEREKKIYAKEDERYLNYLGRTHQPVCALPGTWVAYTDLHVHEGLLLNKKQVPEEDQFDWEDRDSEGRLLGRPGKACFRNFLHLAFERK